MRNPLLTRHFLQRFFDNDLISPDTDRHEVLSVVCATLVTSGLFAGVYMSVKYLFRPFQSPAWTAVVALDDHLLFVSWSMIVMALVAVATWDTLALDSRDASILGPLPIPRAHVVRAKLEAVGLFALAFALALNLVPSVVQPLLMVAKLPVGLLATVWLIVVQAGVTILAGAAGFLMVLAVRELLRALVGAAWFGRISTVVQAMFVVSLATTLLLLPSLSSRVARWLPTDIDRTFWLPPFWFLGLFEMLAGNVVYRLPRGDLPPRTLRDETRATAVYESLRLQFDRLGYVALAATAVVVLVAIVAYAWNARRLPAPPVTRRTRTHGVRSLLRAAAARVLVRRPVAQAAFFFTLQCLFRSLPHRLAMATSAAVGVAAATVTLRGTGLHNAVDGTATVGLLAVQTVLVIALLIGFRHAVRVPAELRASLTFHLSWSGEDRHYSAGVKRAALVGVILPTLLALLPLHVIAGGPRFAVAHLVNGLLIALAFQEALMLGVRGLPFASPYVPSDNLKSMVPIYLVAGILVIYGLASIELLALATTRGSLIMAGTLLALWSGLEAVVYWRHRTDASWMVLDDLHVANTQRLDLSG
jgi:hypothetical protein